jgi:putative transposase
MNYILANHVLRASSSRAPFDGSYRVILVSRQSDRVWLIQLSRSDQRNICYHRGPRYYSLREIELLVRQSLVDVTEGTIPPEWLLSDAQIQKRYGRSPDAAKCSQLERRDRRWGVIEPITRSYTTFDLLERGRYRQAVAQRARELEVSVKKVAALLHLYWAGAGNMNSLMPRYHNSGAPGKFRVQRKKLGRPNVAVRNSMPELEGFQISEEDREKLRFGWETFVRPGVTVVSAYRRTMEVFYRAGTSAEGDSQVAIFKPAHERPTLRQFRYWGSGGDATKSASYLQLRAGEFEKNHRALPGTARDGVSAVGQVAFCDATPNDLYLVSAASRIRPVGTAHRILIVDAYTGLWPGLYCGFEPPSAETALMAVANAALDKVDFCARFGIEITSDMWPAVSFSRYLCDNGEFRSEASIRAIAGFGSTLEFAPVGRADLKGPVESDHHVLHARLDHKLDGTTQGRRRGRGEDHPALAAALTYFEYMRHLILRILHHNNRERCEHLLTTEMRRDGVVPTRINIYRWCVENGYIAGAPPSPDVVRAHLLPTLPAVLTASGIYLTRPDRGRRVEIVSNARFVGDVLLREGLMMRARARHEHLEVRGDPQDMSHVWLVRDGIHELRNVSHDPQAVREWTLADHLAVQDSDALAAHLAKGDSDQDESNLDSVMFADLDKAKREKQLELERQARRPSKSARVAGIRRNRNDEKDRMRSANSQAGSDIVKSAVNETTSVQPKMETSSYGDSTSPTFELLRRFRPKRGSR